MILKKTYGMLKPVDEQTLKFLFMIDEMCENGKADTAKILVDHELKKADGHPEVLLRKAEILMNSAKIQEAFDVMKSLYQTYPAHPYIIYDYALLMSHFSEKKALGLFKSLLKLDVENAEFYYCYSAILCSAQKYKESRNMLRTALEKAYGTMPEEFDQVSAYTSLIKLNLDINDYRGYESAVDQLIEYLKDKKTDLELQKKLALCYVMMSNYLDMKQVRHHFKKFIDFLKGNHYMNRVEFAESFESAYVSLESYELFESKSVSNFIYDFCSYTKEEYREFQHIESNIYRVFAVFQHDLLKKDMLMMEELYPHYYQSVYDEFQQILQDPESMKNRMLNLIVNDFREFGLSIEKSDLVQRILHVYDELYDDKGMIRSRKGKRRNMGIVELIISK